MQKAIKWLDKKGVNFTFHDYKISGIDKKTIHVWLKKCTLEQLINLKSTTFKNLHQEEKKMLNNPDTAIEILIKNPTIIKRPVLENGKNLLIGFKEEEWNSKIKGAM
ncbi:MAG: Spx/MgsR family RNA polymerase-binding regulatory protein [Bacteroidia bacterium]|nr:Spx/MgsR family RNA polymerase-binding regulatory protein [Bacteroidia bacterium]